MTRERIGHRYTRIHTDNSIWTSLSVSISGRFSNVKGMSHRYTRIHTDNSIWMFLICVHLCPSVADSQASRG